MSLPAAEASLAGLPLVLALVLVAYLVVGEPLAGRWFHGRFLAAVRRGDQGARMRFYRLIVGLEWALVGLVAVLVALGAGLTPAYLGVRTPVLGGGPAVGFLVGAAVAGLVGVVIGLVVARRRLSQAATTPAPPVVGGEAVTAMLPQSTRERWAFAGVAVTAGVCEEVLYRGFLLAVVVALAPQVPPAALVAVSAVAFGVARAYQGVYGVLFTGLLGGLFGYLYLSTGSLAVPVLLHVLLDLRALLLPVATLEPAPPAPAT